MSRRKRHCQPWDASGHRWERLVYVNATGARWEPPHRWRCPGCGAVGYGETSAGGRIEPVGLAALDDGVMAREGWRRA